MSKGEGAVIGYSTAYYRIKTLLSLNTAKSVAMESRNKYPLGDIYFEVPLMGNFLIMGKTKATNFLRLIAFGFIII